MHPVATMDEERELYWYDDATYDIGFYNYYQRTVDPSPWALIVCILFCGLLAILLPRYISIYRSLPMNEETKGKPSENQSNTSIYFESQEFVASDSDPHDNRQDINVKQTLDDEYHPTVSERALKDLKTSPKTNPKREKALNSARRTTLSLIRSLRQTKDGDESNIDTDATTKEGLDHSTDYSNMEDNESVSSSHRWIASDEMQKSPREISRKLREARSYGNQAKSSSTYISSESEPTNPLDIIKNDFGDFTDSNPNDVLSVASSWEEEFDPAFQTTLYFHPRTGMRTTEKPVERISDEIRPWYLFYCSPAFRRKIRKCGRWDDEMEKIVGLALPYTAHTIVVDVFGLLEVAIIGRLLGTSMLSAYFATEFAISFATMFFHGILASLKVLVSQAHGAKNVNLAGTYVQIGICTHHLVSLPLVLYGWNNFDDVVLRLGLDEDTAESAEQYARFVLIYEAIGIYDGALHCVLDVTGHEKYSAISNGVRAFVSFLAVLTVSKVNKYAELWMVGAIHLIVKVIFIFFNLCIIFHKQWLSDYWNEVGGNPFKDWRTVKTLWKASLRLSSGRVIENCEWNILFVFAAIQGPAEVAIWGLVGELWDFSDDIVIAISDASKVRCAHLLGSGLPAQAKYSSEKSLLMGVAVSIIMSISLGFLQSAIPRWLTHDFTLQRLLGDIIPMVCLAIATLSFGSVCCSILCAQGRSHLATAITGFGSLAVALPLACLSNFCFNLNLQGLMSCLIIGYASSGFCNSILVLTSNWAKISQKVRKKTSRIEEKLVRKKKKYVYRIDSTNTGTKDVKTGD